MFDDRTITDQKNAGSPRQRFNAPFLFCDGQGLKRLMRSGLVRLRYHQEAINAVNVYPVPDGDTGTNMLLTLQSAYQMIQSSSTSDVGIIAQKLSHGALMGARGNSGVILSQILWGFSRSLEEVKSFDHIQLALALSAAANTAYRSVITPVEGTILTIVREIAEKAMSAAADSEDLHYILEQVVCEARASLIRTPTLLKPLADAGVVDAGGQGLLMILEGMLRDLNGEQLTTTTDLLGRVDLNSFRQAGGDEYGYDVQFIIQGEELNVEEIREVIASMGECVLVVGNERIVKVHAHLPTPDTLINYGVSLGSLSQVIIENMQNQYQNFILSKG